MGERSVVNLREKSRRRRAGGCKESGGYTLVEAVVAAGLLVVLLLAIAGFCQSALCIYRKSEDLVEVQDNLIIAMDRMTRELRQAKEITAASKKTEIYFKDSSGTTVSYYLEGKVLKRRREVEDPVANWITGLEFVYRPYGCDDAGRIAGNTLVEISMTGEKGKSGPLYLSSTVKIRQK